MTTIDLSQASVRPAGSAGLALRTAAGFVVLASPDGVDLVSYVSDHQLAPDLIERLAAQIPETDPRSMAMLFTSGGQPYLVAWGNAVAAVSSGAARFTVTPVAGQLLVHPLSIDAESTVVLSDGSLDGDPQTAPINLAEGSIQADAVVIDLTGDLPTDWQMPSAETAPIPDPADPAPLPADLVESVPPEPQPEPAMAPEPVMAPAPAVTPVDAAGQPAAEGIVFADDLDEGVEMDVPAPAAAPSPFSDGVDAPTAVQPAEPGPAFDAPVVVPLERPSASAPAASAATDVAPPANVPPAMPTDAPAPQVPPEFRRDAAVAETAAMPAAVEAASAVQAPAQAMAAPAAAEPVATTSSAGPVMVLGVVCPQGHHNHPEAVYCSHCGTKLGVHQTTVLVNGPRPPLGVLVVDDGTTFSIDRDLVIGRDPAAHVDVRAGAAAPMVLVDDTLALSRQHARIVLSDWTVHVADLGSSNGTWLNRGPNPQEWMSVEAGSAVPLQPGDRIKVGGRIVQVELHHIR